MRRILLPLITPDRADHLPPRHDFAFSHREATHMRVERVHGPLLPAVEEAMRDHDHVAPRRADLFRDDHLVRADRVDRLAVIGVAAATSVPVFTGGD